MLKYSPAVGTALMHIIYECDMQYSVIQLLETKFVKRARRWNFTCSIPESNFYKHIYMFSNSLLFSLKAFIHICLNLIHCKVSIIASDCISSFIYITVIYWNVCNCTIVHWTALKLTCIHSILSTTLSSISQLLPTSIYNIL